jgi:diguanylate cyclase (GGDEF)-like protein
MLHDKSAKPVKMTPARPCSASWRRAAVALLLLVGAGLNGAAASDVTLQLAALERDGRARPEEAARALQRLVPATATFSAERLEVSTVLGLELAAARQMDDARALAQSLQTWADRALAPAAAAAGLLVRAGIEAQGGNFHTADTLLTGARARLPAGLPARTRLRYVAEHAYVKQESGQLEAALRLYQEALALADELGSPEWQVDMRCGLARVSLQAGQPERARAWNREALAIAERSGDDYSIYRAHGTEGVLRDGANDRDGMREEFEMALVHARLAKAGLAESLTLSNLSDFYLKSGDFSTAYAMAQQALPLARQLGDKDGEIVALFNAGVALISMRNLELGKRYVNESIAIDERRGALSSMSVSYNEFGSYLEKAGDTAGAVAAFHRYRAIDDDIVRRDQQKSLVELQQRFDAERKNRDLAVLNRESEIKSEQLHQQGLQQELWWLLAASCSLPLAALLWLYGRVRRTNRLLARGNRELALQSERDPLTGLANRRHFHATIARTPAEQPFAATLLVIDVDHFKAINDTHGHAVGDGVLVEIARRLSTTVGDAGLIVRWGGEEFLIAARVLGADAAHALADRLLRALAEQPVQIEGRAVTVTASIGFATFPIDGGPAVTAERAIRLVDGALYLAKSQGRNRACGVLRLNARDDATFDAAAAALDAAARAGQATLNVCHGPTAKLAA